MSAFSPKAKSSSSNTSSFNSRKSEDFFGVQAKLNIGKSNDKYEAEADTIADKIVSNKSGEKSESFFNSSPIRKNQATEVHKKEINENEIQEKPLAESITPVVQLQPIQKCDCEDESVQKKEENDVETDTSAHPGFESRLNSSKGSGSALSKETKTEMESGFGADFSNVRIHNDSNAVQMSREIGAQAFANGNDIYFNEGKYNPNSQSGKHLLAHELTHTIQQGKSQTIQKATDPNFAITGLSPSAGSNPNTIFFEMGSSSINTEEPKVDALAANTNQNYDLEGFASEEGSDSVNNRIAQARINSVSNMLIDKGHAITAIRRPINSFDKGNEMIDYRDMRKVEVRNNGDASPPGCNITPANPHPEDTACGNSFTSAHPIALAQATRAHNSMDSATGAERTRIENAVAFFFGNASHYDDILEHLRNHVLQVADQVNTVRCHNSCDSTCNLAGAYMPGGLTGPGTVITLCPPFLNEPDINIRVETLIHEAFHATRGLNTQDLAYNAERGFTMIDQSIALRNTDTYVALVKEITNPGSVIGGSSLRDVIDPSITGSQLTDLRRVMGYLEKWVIESTAEMSSLYGSIIEARRLNDWSLISNRYYTDSMVFISNIFGLTSPPTIPLENDQTAVAGINFRLMAMDEFLWESNIAINKDNTVPVQFANGPSEPLVVNDTFLSSGQHTMVYLLVEKIIESNTRIASSEKSKYVDLIEEIRSHARHPAP